MQGGDITFGDGSGGVSIYGEKFDDEGVWLPHTHKGVITTAINGPNTNTSKFNITYRSEPQLNGKNTVFGRVIDGWDICKKA